MWTFFTVPGPGEIGMTPGRRPTTCGASAARRCGRRRQSIRSWTCSIVSTGNAGPDFDGSIRPGDNLFTASIVAIDAKTGEYRWHFQQVHHDIWDYDVPSPGGPLRHRDQRHDARKALAEPSKTGWVYILDRATGEPLIGIEERPVPQEPRQATAATQPYPIGDSFVPQSIDIAPEGHRLVNGGRIFTPFWMTPVVAQSRPGRWRQLAAERRTTRTQAISTCAPRTALASS